MYKGIEAIYLIHHSHTDIGHTHDQPVVWDLHRRFIDAALDQCERDAGSDADHAFRWTVETTAMLMHWLASASECQVQRFIDLVRAGRIEVTGMFLNTCIYSHIKTVSSSEVAAMIEGVLRHCTDMTVEKNFVDSYGQSEIAFAFTRLLGFQLMPRLKGIHAQKLYRPFPGQKDAYPHLQPVLSRPINWDVIRQQYDEMVKFATALRLGTAETEAILRRFTRSSVQHPTYAALAELGKVVKTIFLCSYLRDPAVRREVHEGLQVVENWNSANNFIHYGKGGEIATNRLDDQEVSVLCMTLVQNALCLINTLVIQRVLAEPTWMERMTAEDLRGLTPLIYAHVNPYGVFRLDMDERLALEEMEAVG